MSNKVYITPEGSKKLREELNQLWRVIRPAVTQQVSQAAALGDRSENADYIYGKKRLREIDRRIRYLSKRLDRLEVVDRTPEDQSSVFFGAWVTLSNSDGEITRLRIVGSDEFDSGKGWISLESPMARSLIGKKKGSSADVELPDGRVTVSILDVSYAPLED